MATTDDIRYMKLALDEAAKAFVEQYATGFPEKPVMMVGFMTPPAFGPLVYKYSREYFAAH